MMYPSWQTPNETPGSVQPYWTQHVNQAASAAAAHQKAAAAAAAYDPLLYPQNYMNNMKNMLGAAAQWVESSST